MTAPTPGWGRLDDLISWWLRTGETAAPRRPVVVVTGELHPRQRRRVARLAGSSWPVVDLPIDGGPKTGPRDPNHADPAVTVRAVADRLIDAGHDLIILAEGINPEPAAVAATAALLTASDEVDALGWPRGDAGTGSAAGAAGGSDAGWMQLLVQARDLRTRAARSTDPWLGTGYGAALSSFLARCAARRTPVLIGESASVVTVAAIRDLAGTADPAADSAEDPVAWLWPGHDSGEAAAILGREYLGMRAPLNLGLAPGSGVGCLLCARLLCDILDEDGAAAMGYTS